MTNSIEKTDKISFLDIIRADFYAMEKSNLTFLKFIKVMLIRPRFSAVFYFRCSSSINGKRIIGKFFSRLFWLLNYYLNGCEISPKAKIGGGLNLPHPHGIVIGMATIGKNVNILQHVSIGLGNFHDVSFSDMKSDHFPVIEDEVTIFAGAAVVGSITVGKGAMIGANAVVTKNVPPYCTAVGIPANILPPREKKAQD